MTHSHNNYFDINFLSFYFNLNFLHFLTKWGVNRNIFVNFVD